MIRILIQRLVKKGMEVSTIPAYIRNLGNTLTVNTHLNTQELNRRLQLLGWDDFELDDHTLQLILTIFGTDGLKSSREGGPLRFEGTLNPGELDGTYRSEN
jgi:hypothetical protein